MRRMYAILPLLVELVLITSDQELSFVFMRYARKFSNACNRMWSLE